MFKNNLTTKAVNRLTAAGFGSTILAIAAGTITSLNFAQGTIGYLIGGVIALALTAIATWSFGRLGVLKNLGTDFKGAMENYADRYQDAHKAAADVQKDECGAVRRAA